MKTIGRAERVDLAGYKLLNIPAKVDTGAYSSSIDHSYAAEKNGKLEFVLLRPGTNGYSGQKLVTDEYETTEVKNANGVQERFVIFPDMTTLGQTQRCRLTLANRSSLMYPVLIGRRFLREGGYIVDVQQGTGLPDDEENRQL